MPRFFFHLEGSFPDKNGIELQNIAEAKCEAVRLSGRLIYDSASTFWDAGEFGLTVTDANGLTLFSLRLVGTEAPAIQHLSPSPPISS